MSTEEILGELREIKEILSRQQTPLDALPDWITLPNHVRKTFMVCLRLKEVTAYSVSDRTKRARAVESGYLNQLVILGYLKKERRGRIAWFMVIKPWTRGYAKKVGT